MGNVGETVRERLALNEFEKCLEMRARRSVRSTEGAVNNSPPLLPKHFSHWCKSPSHEQIRNGEMAGNPLTKPAPLHHLHTLHTGKVGRFPQTECAMWSGVWKHQSLFEQLLCGG